MDLLAYRQALRAAASRSTPVDRYRALPASGPGASSPQITLHGDQLSLTIWLTDDGSTIAMARFQTEGEDAAILAGFCQTVEGLPIEEAAAYGADYAFLPLSREVPRPATFGIAPVAVVLPALIAAQDLLRTFRQERRTRSGAAPIGRARFLAVPHEWQQAPAEDRLARIRGAVREFLDRQGMPHDVLVAERLDHDAHERPTRLVVTHPKSDDRTDLPPLMRALELHLRKTAAPWVEVYAEERIDRNALRRTILTDLRKS